MIQYDCYKTRKKKKREKRKEKEKSFLYDMIWYDIDTTHKSDRSFVLQSSFRNRTEQKRTELD